MDRRTVPGSRLFIPLGFLLPLLLTCLTGAAGRVSHPWGHSGRAEAQAAAEDPKRVPGAATIAVKARDRHGARLPDAQCHIGQRGSQPLPMPPMPLEVDGPRVQPTVTGADGDWVILNVEPGEWHINVTAEGFAYSEDSDKAIEVGEGEQAEIEFVLLRGGSVAGRVMAAHTREPIAGALVATYPWARKPIRADAEGRYVLEHLAPGQRSVFAWAEGYVTRRSQVIDVQDEQLVTAPDIVLTRGGWIEGRLVLPDERLSWDVIPELQGGAPDDVAIPRDHGSVEDDAFRLGALPAGTYRITARARTSKLILPETKRWVAEVNGIKVRVGEVTHGVVIDLAQIGNE